MRLKEYVKTRNYSFESRGLEALWTEKFQEGVKEYDDPKTLDLSHLDWVVQEECYLEVFPGHFKAFVKKAEPIDPGSPWLPISEAPKDGTVVDLWLGNFGWDERKADMVWYEPGGVWMHKETTVPDTDMFGTGTAIPTHFMYPPKGPNSLAREMRKKDMTSEKETQEGFSGYVTRPDGSEGEGHSFIRDVATDPSGALRIHYVNQGLPFIYAPGTWETFVPEEMP